MCTGLVCLRIGTGGGLLWIRYWTFGFQTTRDLSSSAQFHGVSQLNSSWTQSHPLFSPWVLEPVFGKAICIPRDVAAEIRYSSWQSDHPARSILGSQSSLMMSALTVLSCNIPTRQLRCTDPPRGTSRASWLPSLALILSSSKNGPQWCTWWCRMWLCWWRKRIGCWWRVGL
jgi:hypothetical protein